MKEVEMVGTFSMRERHNRLAESSINPFTQIL
jgi:hypothetical protein